MRYNAPDKLVFKDECVDYIFCAHLIEHLYFKELHKLFKEFDRVLKPGGILVISSPMLRNNFYNTFSHVKPYHPTIFNYYFYNDKIDVSYTPISRTYKLEELVYRYHTQVDMHNSTGSSIKIIDFIIQGFKWFFRALGIRKYTQSGYTIILRKGDNMHTKEKNSQSNLEDDSLVRGIYKNIDEAKKDLGLGEEKQHNIEGKIDCDGCHLWGECDHQSAYKINGRWCYENE